ncbi:MAG: hypothetical protein PWP45_1792 [Tepidanaerobacteraceae bacterium]|nr:hypothetical protein [Tepidanaerobacteraceae bacterium]
MRISTIYDKIITSLKLLYKREMCTPWTWKENFLLNSQE